MTAHGMTIGELLSLPSSMDVPEIGRATRIGKTSAYQLAARGELPVPVFRVGGQYRIGTGHVIALLGAEELRFLLEEPR